MAVAALPQEEFANNRLLRRKHDGNALQKVISLVSAVNSPVIIGD